MFNFFVFYVWCLLGCGEFATHTMSLLWAICVIILMSSPCSGSSELTVSWSPVSSPCRLIVISLIYLTVRYSGELIVSMVLAHIFTGLQISNLASCRLVGWKGICKQLLFAPFCLYHILDEIFIEIEALSSFHCWSTFVWIITCGNWQLLVLIIIIN